LQLWLTCQIYYRVRGVFLKAHNSRLPSLPVTTPEASKKYNLGTDLKENTTSERTPKKITDLELTKKKTPPLHSNSPPSPSNTHTNKVSPFRFYIYIDYVLNHVYHPKIEDVYE
jgi:hypothetical protein